MILLLLLAGKDQVQEQEPEQDNQPRSGQESLVAIVGSLGYLQPSSLMANDSSTGLLS